MKKLIEEQFSQVGEKTVNIAKEQIPRVGEKAKQAATASRNALARIDKQDAKRTAKFAGGALVTIGGLAAVGIAVWGGNEPARQAASVIKFGWKLMEDS